MLLDIGLFSSPSNLTVSPNDNVFLVLFKQYTVDLHKTQLQNYAQSLAQSLSSGRRYNGMGYGAHLYFSSEIMGYNVWIVDENMNVITPRNMQHHKMMHANYTFSELPPNASEVIREVFQDKTVFSEGFSDVLSQLTLTVGVPIKDANGKVWGAVLLHSPVEGTTDGIYQGLMILGISIILALIIVLALAILFSYFFTKPLTKMKSVAMQLAEGNYQAKCNIKQKDEVGELANIMDLLAGRLDEASKESLKLEQMRKDFVSNISHELRTPVTVIRGSLEALCDKIITDPKQIDEYHLPSQCDLLTSGNYSCYLMVSSIKKSIAWHPACSYGYFTYNGFDTIIVCSQNHSYGLFSKTGKKHKLHFYIPKPETLMSQDDSHTQICFYYNHSKDEFICDWGSIYIGSSKN